MISILDQSFQHFRPNFLNQVLEVLVPKINCLLKKNKGIQLSMESRHLYILKSHHKIKKNINIKQIINIKPTLHN